jgi:DNA (cytosine-5)-methyltransferase 1
MAFDKLGIDYEVVGISEIDKYALASYKAMHNECPNLGSITDIKGKDMPKTDIFTYSFPCTDLSKAGQQKGLNTDTRSGLIFEVLRLLHEMQEHNKLPHVLIMENVVDFVQVKFIEQWKEIQFEIEQMGYANYTFTMNAKNYGVAQNRDRVFMVSILGQYYYEVPKPIPLEKRLKDYLELNVDDSYYLSDGMLHAFTMSDTKGFNRAERFEQSTHTDIDNAIAFTINTKAGGRPTDNFIKIPANNKQGYCLAFEGDGVDTHNPHKRHTTVSKQITNTLVGNSFDVGVVVKEYANYVSWEDKKGRINTQDHRAYDQDKISGCVPAIERGIPKMFDGNLKIRKLTPRECWRLMGINDSYFDKASQVVSKSQLYKQAGNGIVVDVFAHILKELL